MGGLVQIDSGKFLLQMYVWAAGIALGVTALLLALAKKSSKWLSLLAVACNTAIFLFPIIVTLLLASHS